MFSILHNALLSIVYPQECRVCGTHIERHSDRVACRACWEATRFFSGDELLCGKCGALFEHGTAGVPVVCDNCNGHFYDKAAAAGIYEKALAAVIVNLKSVPILPKRLEPRLARALEQSGLATPEIIIPVPLSPERRIERGFNQAEIIAAATSRLTGVCVDSLSLRRKLHTPIHRAGMDRKARELTVANAFEVVRPNLIKGKKVLLVDDVFTSGATTSACAKALKKNGACRVEVLTLARAIML